MFRNYVVNGMRQDQQTQWVVYSLSYIDVIANV